MDWPSLQQFNFNVVFIGSMLAMALWESRVPWQKPKVATGPRWLSHGLLFVCNSFALPLLLRISPLLLAVSLSQQPSGLLHRPWIPAPLQFALAILLLDLGRYGSHRLFHAVAPLWRIHEVHHSDPDYDVSTALRFHPLETGLDQLGMFAMVLLLAPPPAAVFSSEVLATLLNSFVHANIRLPRTLERIVRRVFLTPDLHRTHHSTDISDQNTNFGQTFTFWDRVFGTFRDQPAGSPEAFATGLVDLPHGAYDHRSALLLAPFQRRKK